MDQLISSEPKNTIEIDPYDLDERQIKLAEFVSMGMKTCEISFLLNVSDGWVRSKKKEAGVVKLVNELQQEALIQAKSAITINTLKAAKKVVSLLNTPDPKTQLAAAKDILDRGNIKPEPDIPPGNTINFNFAQMEMDDLKKSLIERFKALNLEGGQTGEGVYDVTPTKSE